MQGVGWISFSTFPDKKLQSKKVPLQVVSRPGHCQIPLYDYKEWARGKYDFKQYEALNKKPHQIGLWTDLVNYLNQAEEATSINITDTDWM